MKISETSMATIFIGMQLLVKNSDVKENLIQIEAIDMQSLLRNGIITDNLLCKYHESIPKNRK